MFNDKKNRNALISFCLTGLLIAILEITGGVFLDPISLLRFIFVAITDTLTPLLPTTGPFALSATTTIMITNFVYLFLCVLPGILVAGAVYKLTKDG